MYIYYLYIYYLYIVFNYADVSFLMKILLQFSIFICVNILFKS